MADWSGKLVRLRCVDPGDLDRYELDARTHRDDMRAYMGFVDFELSAAQLRPHLERMLEPSEDDNRRWAIERLEDAELLGGANTMRCDPRAGVFEYGIAIFAEQRRRGYASDAIRIVLRHYFHERRYQKANAWVYAFNTPSAALHERLGFRREGQIRRAVYTRGAHHDLLIYGITREEFDASGSGT